MTSEKSIQEGERVTISLGHGREIVLFEGQDKLPHLSYNVRKKRPTPSGKEIVKWESEATAEGQEAINNPNAPWAHRITYKQSSHAV